MQKEEWKIHVKDDDKRLYVTRNTYNPNGPLSPCNMTPNDVDYEMAKGKNRKIIEICGMNQESFEYFIDNYGDEYEYISFFKCQLIYNFKPLEKLKNLQGVNIFWNIKTDTLWDMSKNPNLKYLHINDCKKITYNPTFFNSAIYLEELFIGGDMDNPYPMKNLEWLKGMNSLKKLEIFRIKLEDKNTDILAQLPSLERFDFQAGLFTTEQIAYLCAKYPHIKGYSLCAYNTEDAIMTDVRVCGYKKPGLKLPKDQARLDKYIKHFNELVEMYKQMIN